MHTFEEEDDRRQAHDVSPVKEEPQTNGQIEIPDTILEPESEPEPELESESALPEHDLTPKPSILLQKRDNGTEHAATKSDIINPLPQTQLETISNQDDSTPVQS